jgi:hypothetical protein
MTFIRSHAWAAESNLVGNWKQVSYVTAAGRE